MRVGLLTSGGDCPGLNAALWGATAVFQAHGVTAVGIRDGFEGLVRRNSSGAYDVDLSAVDWTREVREGGSLLGSTRCHPHKDPAMMDAIAKSVADLDALLVVGGDGSLRSACKVVDRLAARGVSVLLGAVPKTIDNDVAATEAAIGFASAVSRAVDACDAAQTTARSHRRTMVVEVMGRHSGALAAAVALAGAAQRCVIPEHEFDPARFVRWARETPGGVVVVAEGASIPDGPPHAYDEDGWIKPGFPSTLLSELLNRNSVPARAVVLGHVLRGGPPVAQDRELAIAMGACAASELVSGRSSLAVLRSGHVEPVAVSNALAPASELHQAVVDRLDCLALC